ncbi:MAG: hypothetical protein K6G12_00115 [Lachnospiraceae bacterium]|nr:hypothetical protein [Lachnospiraceae bacterium]
MKKVFIRSIIAAVAVEITGAAINLVSYAVNGEFPLAIMILGGEWMGWRGFGLLLNHTYAMSSPDNPNAHDSTWIDFAPRSLVSTLLVSFMISFAVFFIIYLVKKYWPASRQK